MIRIQCQLYKNEETTFLHIPHWMGDYVEKQISNNNIYNSNQHKLIEAFCRINDHPNIDSYTKISQSPDGKEYKLIIEDSHYKRAIDVYEDITNCGYVGKKVTYELLRNIDKKNLNTAVGGPAGTTRNRPYKGRAGQQKPPIGKIGRAGNIGSSILNQKPSQLIPSQQQPQTSNNKNKQKSQSKNLFGSALRKLSNLSD